MSLINQMLRDLDARRGTASTVETAALHGLGLADSQAAGQHALLQRTGWGIGLILTGVLIQQGYQLWSEQRTIQNTVPTVISAPPEIPVRPAVSTTPKAVTVVETLAPETVSTAPETVPAPPASEAKQTDSAVHTAAAAHKPRLQASVISKQPRIVRKPLAPAQKAQRRFNNAQGLLTNGQFRDAVQHLRAALELNPKMVDARLQLAALYLHQSRPDRAQQLLEAGYRIDPGNTRIAMAYIRLLAEQGEYRLALELMDSKLQQGTLTADTLALAAALHYRMKNFDTSASYYREALVRNPYQAVWWMGLGVSLEHNQQPAEALEAYRRTNTAALDSTLKSFVTGRIAALSGRTD